MMKIRDCRITAVKLPCSRPGALASVGAAQKTPLTAWLWRPARLKLMNPVRLVQTETAVNRRSSPGHTAETADWNKCTPGVSWKEFY